MPVLCFTISACANIGEISREGPFLSRFTKTTDILPETVTSDYLKGRFAARYKALDVAADAYSRAVVSVPDDLNMVRHAFFYDLAAGRPDGALRQARALSDLAQQNIDLREGSGPRNTGKQTGTADDLSVGDGNILTGVAGVSQSGADLPVLLRIADAFARSDYAEAGALMQRDFANVYSESLVHLLRVWLALETDGALAALKIIQSDNPDLFTGFSTLHQGYLLEIAREPGEAGKAYEAAAGGFNAQVALRSFAGFLERSAREDPDLVAEALAVHRNLAAQMGPLRRVGRLGLARMGEKESGNTREFSRLAARIPPEQITSGRKGAAQAFYNFAQSSLEQAVTEQIAIRQLRLRSSPFSPLNTPLALAQIALYLDPDLHAARYLIGSIYADFGMDELAIKTYSKIPFASAYHVYAQLDTARALDALGREKEIVTSLKALLAKDPYLPEAALTYAEVLGQEHDYDAARGQLTRMIEYLMSLPESSASSHTLWRFYFARGALEIEQDNWAKGEDDLKIAVELAPEQPLVLNFLGYSWAERGVNLAEAFEMIEKAVKLQPRSGAIIDSLGWAYYQLGDYTEAVKHLERAVHLEPADPTVTEHLGDVYWQLDRKIEAKYQWRHVLTLAPEEEIEARVRGKIENGLTAYEIPEKASLENSHIFLYSANQ